MFCPNSGMRMRLELDPTTGIPLADQIVSGVRQWIMTRTVRAGAKMPSIRQLASEHGISRFPVIDAYDRLVSLGLLRSRHGSGFFVTDNPLPGTDHGGWSDPSLAESETGAMLEQFNYPGEMLKLGSGFIPEDWRDMQGLTAAIRHVSRVDASSLIDYGVPLGSGVLRQQIQTRLTQLGIHVDPTQVMITNGASQAIDLVIRYLLKPGDIAFVEDPGYYTLYGLLKLQGVQLVGIPRTIHGPDLDVVESMLKKHRPKLFFINSVFHNPTGTTISPPVAFRLLQLARTHGFTILEDDIYADLQTDPTDRLATLDQLEQVIYVGGLSKTLSSSLRVGYVVANHTLLKHLVDIKMLSAVGGSRFAEAVAATLLERGAYRKYLERLRRRIRDTLTDAIRLFERSGWELFAEPAGGHFVWARVPGVEDSARLGALARQFGVTLAPGSYYRPEGNPTPYVRINVGHARDPRAQRFIEQASAAAAQRA